MTIDQQPLFLILTIRPWHRNMISRGIEKEKKKCIFSLKYYQFYFIAKSNQKSSNYCDISFVIIMFF